MTSKKKSGFIVIAMVIVLVAVSVPKVPAYSMAMEAKWGISLPFKALCSQVYEKDSGPSFLGDGIRYHVFEYRYEDYIDLIFAWSAAEHETLHFASVSEAADAWLDEIEVPEDRRPDYEACGSWHRSKKDSSEIIFFWDSERNLIYVVENFL